MTVAAQNLLDRLSYDPDSGTFRWAVPPSPRIAPGKVAGYGHPEDWLIAFRRKNFSARRLAWLQMTGEWPPSGVRNKNGNVHDFRWENLELSTPHDRSIRGAVVTASSGHRSIYLVKGRFMLQINRGGKVAIQKSFAKVDEAIAARDAFLEAERSGK